MEEEEQNGSQRAQNYSPIFISSSKCVSLDSSFPWSPPHCPCSLSPTAVSTNQDVGHLTHRHEPFQRLFRILVPILLLLMDKLGFSDWLVSDQHCTKFQLFPILVNTLNVSLLNVNYINGKINVSNFFNFHAMIPTIVEKCLLYLLAIWISLSMKCLLKSLAHYSVGFSVFCMLTCRSFYNVNMSSLQAIWAVNISSAL